MPIILTSVLIHLDPTHFDFFLLNVFNLFSYNKPNKFWVLTYKTSTKVLYVPSVKKFDILQKMMFYVAIPVGMVIASICNMYASALSSSEIPRIMLIPVLVPCQRLKQ